MPASATPPPVSYSAKRAKRATSARAAPGTVRNRYGWARWEDFCPAGLPHPDGERMVRYATAKMLPIHMQFFPEACTMSQGEDCLGHVSICAHTMPMITAGDDRLPSAACETLVPVFRKPSWLAVKVGLEEMEPDGFRAVTFRPVGQVEAKVIGYVGCEASRLAVRSLVLPIVLNNALTMRCSRCNRPVIGAADIDLDKPEIQTYSIILSHRAIEAQSGLCDRCYDDQDLIPNV